MTSAAPTFPPLGHASLRIPAAAFEVLAYLTVVASATLAFVTGWLTVNAAVVITVILLSSLIVLSWTHLGQGRHPCFLFMCTLMLFQGGRLLAYCLGGISDPLRVGLMLQEPFAVPRGVSGLVLLCLALSAICVYAPCRWNFRPVPPPSAIGVRQYLPYLYLVFFSSLPFLLYKNYLYFRYIQEHGGYVVFFSDYGNLTASVPFVVRVMALLPLPALVLIFVFETRKRLLYLVVTLYFVSSIVLLLTGTRMGIFSLILTLWYVARIKSAKPTRIWRLAVLAAALVIVANLIALARIGEDIEGRAAADAVGFIATQGISLGVTEVAVMHPSLFRPYVFSYLLHELQIEFVQADVSNYFRGRQFGYDVSVFLNPSLFSQGFATAGAYIGEAYVIGGVLGVIVVSLLIGGGLRFLYTCGGNLKALVLVAFVLPQALLLPRGFLMGWASSLLRAFILLLPLVIGWSLYQFMTPVFRTPLDTDENSLAR
jgi:hypothetical protein